MYSMMFIQLYLHVQVALLQLAPGEEGTSLQWGCSREGFPLLGVREPETDAQSGSFSRTPYS